jgi:hypothetical protein
VPEGYPDYSLNTWYPLDSSVFTLKEDFAAGLSADGAVGENGWRALGYGTDSVLDSGTSPWPNLGAMLLGGGNAANSGLHLSYSKGVIFTSMGINYGWDSIFIFAAYGGLSTMRMRVGWAYVGSPASQPAWGMWVRFDKDAAFGDTNFKLAVRPTAGGAEASFDTSVPADLLYHRVRIRSLDAGVALMTFDTGPEISFGPIGCDVTVTLGQMPVNPAFICGTTTATSARILADYCAVQAIGLVR